MSSMLTIPIGKILIIEDDPDTRENLRQILELDDYPVETAGSVAEVRSRRDWAGIFTVILDRRLSDGDGESLLPRLRELAPEAAVVMATGHADLQGVITALRAGAADYILKPVNPDLLRATIARLAERRLLALSKLQSDRAFRTLMEHAPCMIVILRADRTIAYFSPFAERLTGYAAADVLGKDYFELCLPPTGSPGNLLGELEDRFQSAWEGRAQQGSETPIRCRDERLRWMIWNNQHLEDYQGQPGLLWIGLDITSLKEAQQKSLQAERLAAIGQMMTGIAHESRNALQRSQSCLELLAMEVETSPAALDLVARIQKAQDHLLHLFEEVRGYAAPIQLERQVCNVQTLWRDTWAHLELARKAKTIRLVESLATAELTLFADRHALEQVFRNIFENAIHACPDPGEITIRTGLAPFRAGTALSISIRDNGGGLSAEQRAKIFEPFYTTKRQGTGLGMAIVRRIVEAHGGEIRVGDKPASSMPAYGAEIILLLPQGPPCDASGS